MRKPMTPDEIRRRKESALMKLASFDAPRNSSGLENYQKIRFNDVTVSKLRAQYKTVWDKAGVFRVRFAGTGASVERTDRGSLINLPTHGWDNKLIPALLLHELGHVLFTDSSLWVDAVISNGRCHALHQCINAFEDVRIERELVGSGYVGNAAQIFDELNQHQVSEFSLQTLNNTQNIAFVIRLIASGATITVPANYVETVHEGVRLCALLKTTQDSIDAGLWLSVELKRFEVEESAREKRQLLEDLKMYGNVRPTNVWIGKAA